MPIFIKNIDFSQNQNSLFIKLNIPGVRKNNLSVISAKKYIKINRSPYLWEAFLRHEIKPDTVDILITENTLKMTVEKEDEIEWETLFDENSNLKEYQNEMRQKALEEIANLYQNHHLKKVEKKMEIKNYLTEEIIKKEENHRVEVENAKRAVRKKLDNELEGRFKREDGQVEKTFKIKEKFIPEPRIPGKITVKFTPRPFPTPVRESQSQIEQKFLMGDPARSNN